MAGPTGPTGPTGTAGAQGTAGATGPTGPTGTANVATDTIWDAAGDLAVGSGSDTATRLAKGNAGAVLAMGNSAVIWNAGTSFPASKATGDRYWRTDLGMEFYWDGSRWLSVTLYFVSVPHTDNLLPMTVSGPVVGRLALQNDGQDVYIEKIYAWTYVANTNSGSNYWGLVFERNPSATSITTFTTAADAPNTHTRHTQTINALTGTSDVEIDMAVLSKTGAPGSLYINAAIAYRIVGT